MLLEEYKMHIESIKEKVHRLLDELPESATWDDLMYKIYVRQTIEAGLEDSEAGRTTGVKELRARFELPK
jgi:predicted transcriptional regulator